ncbi:MAG: sugar phosphate isomerase/epimerase family protein [Halobacteriota archaeon]
MHYGVSSAIETDIADFILRVADAFTIIELVSEYPHVHHSMPNVDVLNKLKQEHALTYTLHAPFCSVNLASTNPNIRKASVSEIINSIHYASTLGCKLVVVHPGIISYPRSLNEFERIAKENELDSFVQICETAEQRKLLVCVENMPRLPPAFKESWTGDEMIKIVDACGSPYVQIALDVGHCNTTDIPIPSIIKRFGTHIKHVHIHDNDGVREAHSIVGQGSVHWQSVIHALKNIGYNGFLIDEHRTIEGQKQGKAFLDPIMRARAESTAPDRG